MNRKFFLKASACWITVNIVAHFKVYAMNNVKPELHYFKDDGKIPNNKLPLLLYKNAFSIKGVRGAEWLENKFAANNWTNSWRWGVYPFHHYHSNTHEVLGVFSGSALLHMGGEYGEKINLNMGDIIVIPAGVGHKCLSHTDDFTVVGAYPDGISPDLKRGEPGERPIVDKNIAEVSFPQNDPLEGAKGGLKDAWK